MTLGTVVRGSFKILRNSAILLAITLGLLVVVEGLASCGLLAYRLLAGTRHTLAERVSTRYDPELGWVAIPNLSVGDMYGPGIYLKTNQRGFRNAEDFTVAEPPGRLRAVCSGDSFTLGFGVDNDQTWCQLLSRIDGHLQTVNMGQGGYGVDQAFLWYRRDGRALRHGVHLFAYITDDFDRMRHAEFLRYGKPVLKLEDGHLVSRNVPVPRAAFRFPWLTTNGPLFLQLRSVELGSLLAARFLPAAPPKPGLRETPEESRTVFLKIIEELHEMDRADSSTLVLVYLPREQDLAGDRGTDEWRRVVREAADRQGIAFIDLVQDLQPVPHDSLEGMFIRPGEVDVALARGHYTVKGNEIIARHLHDRLVALPEIQARLARLH